MDERRTRQMIIALAAFGLLFSIVRLRPSIALPLPAEREPRTPRAALAGEMQVYELSLMQGSPYAIAAYSTVQHECDAGSDDAQIAQACAMFNNAVKHDSNHHAIDAAVNVLKGG